VVDDNGSAPGAVGGSAPGRPGARRRYAVIGLGAVGGYYGARLAAAGHELHVVARSDADHLRRHGLRVESVAGDVSLPAGSFAVHDRPDDVPPVDVVLLAVKTTVGAAAAAGLVRPLARPGTIVVALQNGLGVEAPLAAAAPGCPVLGGMCFVCTNKVGPGHVRHLDYGAVTVGEHRADGRPAGVTPAVEAVAGDLEAAGVAAARLDDLATGRWRKLVWNIPYNGLSVVLGAGTDELMADAGTRRLVRQLMGEVVDGAGACGHTIPTAFADQLMADTDAMRPYRTSMRLDHDAGRPLEIDAIYGAPLEAAGAAGHTMTRTAVLTDQLRFLDRLRSGRGTRPATPA
jgi:2-dehydropantoate 2-reductase